jgi:hypothetical protein
MGEQIYPMPDSPAYDEELRALKDSDPASASETFNPLIEKMVENTHFVKKRTDALNDSLDVFVTFSDDETPPPGTRLHLFKVRKVENWPGPYP